MGHLGFSGYTFNASYCYFVILNSFLCHFYDHIFSGCKASKSYHVQISYYFNFFFFDFTMSIHCHFFFSNLDKFYVKRSEPGSGFKCLLPYKIGPSSSVV